MDPDKVHAVIDWPVPDSRVTLHRFLGFANFFTVVLSKTVVLSETLVVSPPRLLASPRPRLALLGPGLHRMHSIGSRSYLPPLPSSSLLIPRNYLLLRLMLPTSGWEPL